MSFKPPGQCPVCGEWVPKGALACNDCGACGQSGWKENSEVYDGLDLGDDEFNYDEFVDREFGSSKKVKSFSKETFWRWVAALVLAAMVLGYLMSLF